MVSCGVVVAGTSPLLAHLDERNPVAVEDAFAHKFLDILIQGGAESSGLGSHFGNKGGSLLLVDASLEEHLMRLRNHDAHKEFDHISTKIG